MQAVRGVLALFGLTLVGLVSGGAMISDFTKLSVGEMCELMPADTSFLRPHTCNYWVRCPANNTSLEEGTCATGLSYNKDIGRCTMASNVICPYAEDSSSNNNVNKCANETEGTFLADTSSSNCKGYILCKARREVKASCPNDLIFNPTSRSCVYANQYKCPTSPTHTKSATCLSLPNNTRLANDDHCHKYYVCQNDILYERECADQSAYDVALGRCVPAQNATCYATAKLPPPENQFCKVNGTARAGYYPDDESCSHYYICDRPDPKGVHDKNPQHLKCGQGLYFDYEKLSCRDRLNVRCLLDRCADTSLTYVNVVGDCQAYARCAGGVTVGSGRCPADYFFDERSQGCTPINHNYIACV